MEKRPTKRRHIAVIENCTMSENGIRHLFLSPGMERYKLHFFKTYATFKDALATTPFFSVIFSLSGMRGQRIECLKSLHELSSSHPRLQRIVLADDDKETNLMRLLLPTHLHGLISKSVAVTEMQETLHALLTHRSRLNQKLIYSQFFSHSRGLSPTEREVLHYMTYGLSITEIAVQLERNIKTVRAHKFNAMAKLGVHSDAGLLNAADILMHLLPGQIATTAPSYIQ
nr:DNA-binding transcriptional activator BglJ [uncultured Enterobacter sp.]